MEPYASPGVLKLLVSLAIKTATLLGAHFITSNYVWIALFKINFYR